MKTSRMNALAVLVLGSGAALLVSCTEQAKVGHADRATSRTAMGAHGTPPGDKVTIVADQPIPNVQGKRLVSLIVDYAPGDASTSHRHAPSAFIYAYVLSGEIRSQVNDETPRVYRAGEMWFEKPGSHHRISENASDTRPARLMAVFIVDEGETQLTFPDPR